jgi:hypothetical protein
MTKLEINSGHLLKMTLQFERKYSTQGSGALCHVSFGFFSGFLYEREVKVVL